MILYLRERTNLLDGLPKRFLHLAPEPELQAHFEHLSSLCYVTLDLQMSNVDVHGDVTRLPFPDAAFDCIYASHVLEHVPDDRQAMRELRRVLRPGGWAILQVPITDDATFEDPSVTSPKERERLFGQWDHVRRYGPDYRDRLQEAGFEISVDPYVRELPAKTAERFGLDASEDVYFCRAPGSASESA